MKKIVIPILLCALAVCGATYVSLRVVELASTDNAVPRFDGTSGDTLQSSPVTISDAGAIAGASSLAVTNGVTDASGTPLYQVTNANLTTLAGASITGSGNFMRTRTGVYREIWIDAGAMIGSTTNGAATGTYAAVPGATDITQDVYDFDDTTSESTQFRISMPDAWDRGTVKFKFFFTQASATSGTNVMSIAGAAVSGGDSFALSLGTAVTITNAVPASTNTLSIATTGALTVGGTPALNDLLIFNIARLPSDAYDTASGDLRLHGVKMQYVESTTEPSTW